MTTRIDSISIEGFRGVNNKLDLKFDDGPTILFGDNGAAKTSILQAIEWCLTGSLSYLSGPDFSKEDAIVCMFHPKKVAKVSLTLDSNGKKVIATRTRKMYSSTSRGSAPLTVSIDGKTLQEDEATAALSTILDIHADDFSRSVYLHQESIKDLLSTDPAERSRAMDRLLGTFELREFTEALDVKRAVSAKNKSLQQQIDSLKRDKIQFTLNMKERLNRKKDKMLADGYDEASMTAVGVVKELSDMIDDLERLSQEYGGEKLTIANPEPSFASIGKVLDATESAMTKIDRQRAMAYGDLDKKNDLLERLVKSHKVSADEVDSFGSLALEAIQHQQTQLESELVDIEPAQRRLSSLLTDLTALEGRLSGAGSNIFNIQSQIDKILEKVGDESKHLVIKHQLEEKGTGVEKLIGQTSRLGQIIANSMEHVRDESPENCPVCLQPIDSKKLAISLEERAKETITKEIRSLSELKEATKKEMAEVDDSLGMLRRLTQKLKKENADFDKVLDELSRKLGEKVGKNYDFAVKIKSVKEEFGKLNDKVVELRTTKSDLQQQYKSLDKAVRQLQSVEAELQTILDSKKTGKLLTDAAAEEIRGIKEMLAVYRETKEIDALRGRRAKSEQVCGYLREQDEVTRLEKELPAITKLVESYEAAKANLAELEGSLEAVRQVSLEYEKELVEAELKSLGETINNYFSLMMGHPLFPKMTVLIEKDKPLTYSVAATGSSGNTYIPTRFSSAQANSAAIALFLANKERAGTGFTPILMDDPTQSMDLHHQEALAKIVAKLVETNQAIICTQDRSFLDLLKKHCSKRSIYEFGKWTSSGPSVSRHDG